MPTIRTRPADAKPPAGAPAGKQALQPAGKRTGNGASSVLPYLSLPR